MGSNPSLSTRRIRLLIQRFTGKPFLLVFRVSTRKSLPFFQLQAVRKLSCSPYASSQWAAFALYVTFPRRASLIIWQRGHFLIKPRVLEKISTLSRVFQQMQMWAVVSLFVFCAAITEKEPEYGVVRSGTAVVIFYSGERVVFAVESRVAQEGVEGIRYHDDACKVRAINNKFIFVSAGLNGFGPAAGQPGLAWSAYDEPGKLVGQIPDTADDPVKLLAQLWGELLERHVNRGLVVNPDGVKRALDLKGSGLTSGFFAGRTKQGQLVMYNVFLSCDCGAESKHAVLKVLPVPLPDRGKMITEGPKDARALFGELIEDKSERARAATDQFAANHPGIRPPQFFGAATVSGLEFILKYSSSEEIHGPVDAVEITSSGDVHWIQRKANCPDK